MDNVVGDSKFNATELIAQLRGQLGRDEPDYVEISRILARLKSDENYNVQTPDTAARIDELFNQATTQFEAHYETVYQRADNVFHDTTTSFEEKLEALEAATDEQRYQSSYDFFDQHFFPLIRERYDNLIDRRDLLEDDERWDKTKRDLLLSYVQSEEERHFARKDTWWFKHYRRLLDRAIAHHASFDKRVEISLRDKVAAHDNAVDAVNSISQDRTLFNLSRELPRLDKVLAAGVEYIEIDDGVVTVVEAIDLAGRAYIEACLDYAEKQLSLVTGFDLEQYTAVSREGNPFLTDIPVDELHRRIGRAWIVLDPRERQSERRVSGYLSAIYEDTGDTGAGSQESDKQLFLSQPNTESLTGDTLERWDKLKETIDQLFERVDRMRSDLNRIRDGVMDNREAVAKIREILRVYDHEEVVTLWKKVQARNLEKLDARLVRWEGQLIVQVATPQQIEQLIEDIETHPLQEPGFSDADRVESSTREELQELQQRAERLLDIRLQAEERGAEFEEKLHEFKRLQEEQQWRDARAHAQGLRRELAIGSSYISDYSRTVAETYLDDFDQYYADFIDEDEVDQMWNATLKAWDNRSAWQDLLKLYKTKKFDQLLAQTERGAQYRLAYARQAYIHSRQITVQDNNEGITHAGLIAEAFEQIEPIINHAIVRENEQLSRFVDDLREQVTDVERAKATREILDRLVEGLTDDNIYKHREAFKRISEQQVEDEATREAYVSDFVKTHWKRALTNRMQQVGSATIDGGISYAEIQTIREQIRFLKSINAWGGADLINEQQMDAALRDRYSDLNNQPLEDSLFGTALSTEDYQTWLGGGQLRDTNRLEYDEVSAYALMSAYEPHGINVEQAVKHYEALKQAVTSGVIAQSDAELLVIDIVQANAWLQNARQRCPVILYNGLIYAATRLIDQYYQDQKWDDIKQLQDGLEVYNARMRYFNDEYSQIVGGLWRYWSIISVHYHREPFGENHEVRRMYANYRLGIEEANLLSGRENLPYWVRACHHRWNDLEKQVRGRLIGSIRAYLQRGGGTVRELNQYFEYILIVEQIADPNSDPGVILEARRWLDANQGNIQKAHENYDDEIYAILYSDAGLRAGLDQAARNSRELATRLKAVHEGLQELGDDERLKIPANVVTKIKDQATKSSRLSEYLLATQGRYTALKASFRELLDPRRSDGPTRNQIDSGFRDMQLSLGKAIDVMSFDSNRPLNLNDGDQQDSETDGQGTGAYSSISPQECPEYKVLDELRQKVQNLVYEVIHGNLKQFRLFKETGSTSIKHFADNYKRLKDVKEARDKLREHLSLDFDKLFPDEEHFEFDIASDKIQAHLNSSLTGKQSLLPGAYRGKDSIYGLEEHLELLRMLTERTSLWKKRLEAFRDGFLKIKKDFEAFEPWCEYFARCDGIILEHGISTSSNEGELSLPQDIFSGRIIHHLSRCLKPESDFYNLYEPDTRFDDLTRDRKRDLHLSLDEWQKSISALNEDTLTSEVLSLIYEHLRDIIVQIRNILAERRGYLRASDDSISVHEQDVYRQIIYRPKDSNFFTMYHALSEDIIKFIDGLANGGDTTAPNTPVNTGNLIDKIVELSTRFLEVYYRNTLAYILSTVGRYNQYCEQLEDAASDITRPQYRWGGLRTIPPSDEDLEDAEIYRSIGKLLKWQHRS